jgi:hypothetical protein
MAGIVGGIISLTVAIIVSTSVLIPQVIGVNTSSWSTEQQTLWTVVGLMIVLGLLYMTANFFGMLN